MFVEDAAADVNGFDEGDAGEFHRGVAVGADEGVAVKGFHEHLAPGEAARLWFGVLRQEDAGLFDHAGSNAVGEDACVAEGSEVLIGDMLDKSSDEILDADGERGDLVSGAVFVAEGDRSAVKSGDVVFGDDWAFAVAADVADGKGGVLERSSEMQVPFLFIERCEEGVEGLRGADGFVRRRRFQHAGFEEFLEFLEEGVAEHRPQALPGDIVVGDPAFFVGGDAAAGDDGVDVRIPFEISAEGMKDQDEARLVAALAGPGEEGVLDGAEEGAQRVFSVHAHPVAQFLRDGEDEVLVGDVDDGRECGFNPAVDSDFAAGGAEARLAGVRDASRGAAICAEVLGMAPTGSAEEHPGDVPYDGPAQEENVLRPEDEPCIAAQEDLADGDRSPDIFHGG